MHVEPMNFSTCTQLAICPPRYNGSKNLTVFPSAAYLDLVTFAAPDPLIVGGRLRLALN